MKIRNIGWSKQNMIQETGKTGEWTRQLLAQQRTKPKVEHQGVTHELAVFPLSGICGTGVSSVIILLQYEFQGSTTVRTQMVQVQVNTFQLQSLSIIKHHSRASLVGGAITILKNISQWEGLSHILWTIKKCSKPPTRSVLWMDKHCRCYVCSSTTLPRTVMPLEKADHWRRWSDSMDWLKGKNQQNLMFNRKIYGFRLRFSLDQSIEGWGNTQQGQNAAVLRASGSDIMAVWDRSKDSGKPLKQFLIWYATKTIPLNKSCFFCGKVCEQIAVFCLTVCRKNGSNSKPPCLQTVAMKLQTSTPIFRQDEFPPRRPFLMKFISFTDFLDSSALKPSGLPKAWASLLELPPGCWLLVFLLSARFSKTKHDFARKKNRHFLDLFFCLQMFFIDLHQIWWTHLDFHGFS